LIEQLKRQLFDTNNKATYLERQISSNDRDIAKTDQKVKEVLRMMQYQEIDTAPPTSVWSLVQRFSLNWNLMARNARSLCFGVTGHRFANSALPATAFAT